MISGKFRTIFYISIIYAIGQIVLTIGAVDLGSSGLNMGLSFLGLGLIAFGTGGIKPCVVSFGAEQFQLPEQSNKIPLYFSLFYASINAGSLISTFLTPLLRNKKCDGQDTCFPLAFGVPAALFLVAILAFLGGRVCNLYKMVMPEENVITKFFACIWYSFKESRGSSKQKGKNMLDHGEKKYGKDFIEDVRAVLNVLYMFIPFPIYWALFDQQGSLWTFQARRMNGDMGYFQVLPDQMQLANPFMILAFIPLFEYVVYPVFAKFGMLTKPLQRIVTGGTLAGVSFVVSGFLELALQEHYTALPDSGQTHMTIYNGLPPSCASNLNLIELNYIPNNPEKSSTSFKFNFTDSSGNHSLYSENSGIENEGMFTIEAFKITCGLNEIVFDKLEFEGKLEQKKTDEVPNQYVLVTYDLNDPKKGVLNYGNFNGPLAKTSNGMPDIKVIWNIESECEGFNIGDVEDIEFVDAISLGNTTVPFGDTEIKHLENLGTRPFQISCSNTNTTITEVELLYGANYQLVYVEHNTADKTQGVIVHKIVEENVYNMFLILPQFAIMTAGEVMFSITALQFAFSQAPETMKAILQSAFTVTTGVGNIFDLTVMLALEGVFSSQAYLFFMFAGLMFLDMVILALMAWKYKYVDYTEKQKI